METILTQYNVEIFWQLILAAFLGTLIGVEREIAKKTAGMRTFALVALGSCLFSIVSINALKFLGDVGASSFDPTRIAAQIVTGLGFLGAGSIIFDRSALRGITTAAGLWLAAAIGMAVGFQFYAVAVFTTLVALFIFIFLWAFEEKIVKKYTYRPPTNGEVRSE